MMQLHANLREKTRRKTTFGNKFLFKNKKKVQKKKINGK